MAKRKPPLSRTAKSKPDPADAIIQYEFVQMVTEHISDVWVSFDGDIAETLVLGVIGQDQLGVMIREQDLKLPPTVATRGVSASSISDVCNIPRQTVRRKLMKLQDRGLIRQDSEQRWRLVIREDGSIPAHEAFADLYARGIERAKRLAIALKPYV